MLFVEHFSIVNWMELKVKKRCTTYNLQIEGNFH